MKYFVADRCVWIERTGTDGYRLRQLFVDVTGRRPSLGWHDDLRIYITHID